MEKKVKIKLESLLGVKNNTIIYVKDTGWSFWIWDWEDVGVKERVF